MNHLTNLYKHKCEQLQEQINNLKKMLNEAESAGMVDARPYPPMFGPKDAPTPSIPNPTGLDGTPRPPYNPKEGDLWADQYRNVYIYKDGKWVLVQGGERSPWKLPIGSPFIPADIDPRDLPGRGQGPYPN